MLWIWVCPMELLFLLILPPEKFFYIHTTVSRTPNPSTDVYSLTILSMILTLDDTTLFVLNLQILGVLTKTNVRFSIEKLVLVSKLLRAIGVLIPISPFIPLTIAITTGLFFFVPYLHTSISSIRAQTQ